MIGVIESKRFRVPVLYVDNHLLAVEKPPNLPVQRDSSGDEDLLTLCKGYIKERYDKPGAVYLGLVHRLDRPVGGAMVLARTSKAAARLSRAFSAHSVDKRYLAVLTGALREEMELHHTLYKNEQTGMVTVLADGDPSGKEACLRTCPIAAREGLTLTEVELFTGRAHQIRVQHRQIGHPIWGDARYGSGQPGQQIALWAHRLTIEHPTTKEMTRFESLPPAAAPWTLFESELKGLHP